MNWFSIYVRIIPRKLILGNIKKHHDIIYTSSYRRPRLNLHRLAQAGALFRQLDQPDHIARLRTACGKVSLARKSPRKLAVVLRVGGRLHRRVDLLDRLAVLNRREETWHRQLITRNTPRNNRKNIP